MGITWSDLTHQFALVWSSYAVDFKQQYYNFVFLAHSCGLRVKISMEIKARLIAWGFLLGEVGSIMLVLLFLREDAYWRVLGRLDPK